MKNTKSFRQFERLLSKGWIFCSASGLPSFLETLELAEISVEVSYYHSRLWKVALAN